jgi:hypothetical protein
MLLNISRNPQPSEDEFMQMLETTNEALAAIDQVNEDTDHLRKHTAMVATLPCYAMLIYAASVRARLAYGIWP